MTNTQTYLYNLGFVQTQPGYYETPLCKNLVAICDDEKLVSFYNTTSEELVEVGTSTVGDNNNNFTLTNQFITLVGL